jgi:hypothetical protein
MQAHGHALHLRITLNKCSDTTLCRHILHYPASFRYAFVPPGRLSEIHTLTRIVAVNTTQTMCGAPIRDKTDKLLWVSIVSGVLALLAIIVRSTVAFLSGHWRWDDACAIAAWLFSIPLTVLQLITPGLGLGKDTWTVETANIIKVLQVSRTLAPVEPT